MRRVAAAAALALAAALLSPVAAGSAPAWKPRAPVYPEMVTVRDIAVQMSDGVTVYADVHLPSRDGERPARGRFPTVLMITPYNKNFGAETREYLVVRGYASVVAEPRGTGSSEGAWDFGSDRERRDGYDLVEWAAAQPWSSGAVGLIGDSYRGFNQWWTAAEQPPHLRAIAPMNAPADMYRTGATAGGQMSSLVVAQGLVGVLGIPPGNRTGDDPRSAARTLGARPLGIAASGAGTVDIASGGKQRYDSRFYHVRSGYWNADRIRVPALIIGGWYDIAQRDSVLMFEELQARGVPVKLVMGPWTHLNTGAGLPAPGLPYDLDAIHLRWFDRWLAGRPDPGLSSFGPAVYNVQGTEAYRSARQWAPEGTAYRALYLTGTAVAGAPGELATTRPGPDGGGDVLPAHPASGLCSRSSQQALLGGPPDSPCTDDGRANDLTGLAYDLPTSERTRVVAGHFAARLFVSTTGTDAFVNVRIERVAPDGSVLALTDGNDTLSFRALDRRRTLSAQGTIVRPFHPYTQASVRDVEPGEIYEWWIEVLPTAAELPPGHTLRVTIQPSDAAQSIPAGETGVRTLTGVTTIHHDAAHPSAVVVPFLR